MVFIVFDNYLFLAIKKEIGRKIRKIILCKKKKTKRIKKLKIKKEKKKRKKEEKRKEGLVGGLFNDILFHYLFKQRRQGK